MEHVNTATAVATASPITALRQTRKGPISLSAETDNRELAHSIAALIAATLLEEPKRKAHTAAEDACQALKASDPDCPMLARAEAAEAKADLHWQRAYRKVEKAAHAVLAVPVDHPRDALLQQRAFAWAFEATDTADIWDEEELTAALKAAHRALERLDAVNAACLDETARDHVRGMDLIGEYEALGGHLCPLVRPDTGEAYDICIRIAAPASPQAARIEAELNKPDIAQAVLSCLVIRGREAIDEMYREAESTELRRERLRVNATREKASSLIAAE